MKRNLWLLSLTLVAYLVPCPATRAQEVYFQPPLAVKDIDATLRTDWYGLYHEGRKIGYVSTTRERVGEHVVDKVSVTIKLVSFGKKAELSMKQSQTFEGAPPYRLLQGSFLQSDGTTTKKIDVKRVPKGFEYVHAAGGVTTNQVKDDLAYTLSDELAPELWLKGGPKIGDQIQTRNLDFDDWKIETNKHKLVGVKKALVGGVDVKYYEDESVSSKDKIKLLARYSADGKLLSGFLAIFELRNEPEDQAKNIEYSKDLFLLGTAKIDRGIGSTRKLKELVLEVKGKEGSALESGPWQTVIETEPGTRIVKIGKGLGKETRPTAKEIEEALSESNRYPFKHARIQALAKEAIGDAKRPEEKVDRIVHFVRNYIAPHMAPALPNIYDLLDKKQGDCKCYALLTANLCRAAGVPTREVAGLLYMGDDQKAFGGHEWNEVVLNGVWVPVDASLAEAEIDAGHICLGDDQTATKNMLESLGKLSFRVVEVKHK